MSFADKKCLPCEGGVSKLTAQEVLQFLSQLTEWRSENDKLFKTYRFENFVKAMQFVNQMAEIAEQEGHHPDFTVHYNQVDVVLWTHAIDGLSDNDFILASKIDRITI